MDKKSDEMHALGMHPLELMFIDPEQFNCELGRVVDGMMPMVMVTWMLKMVELWGEDKSKEKGEKGSGNSTT
ncbi:MAG: hypothetical protein R6U89_05235 [Dehalococcoidia bacterium]